MINIRKLFIINFEMVIVVMLVVQSGYTPVANLVNDCEKCLLLAEEAHVSPARTASSKMMMVQDVDVVEMIFDDSR